MRCCWPRGRARRRSSRRRCTAGCSEGKIVRFEEITRCPLEIQDVMLSILSDRVMSIPELEGPGRTLYARIGFNVIATANTRDRGVNEMSAALKRRFNFETVHPIADLNEEMALVQRESDRLLRRAGGAGLAPARDHRAAGDDVPRAARGQDGRRHALEPLTTALSTAEAVSTGFAAGLHAYYYGQGQSSRAPGPAPRRLGAEGRSRRPEEAAPLLQPRRQGPHRRRLEGLLREPGATCCEPDAGGPQTLSADRCAGRLLPGPAP